MTDPCRFSDPAPVAAPSFQLLPDDLVKFGFHAGDHIAMFCEVKSHPIAKRRAQIIAMTHRKTLNQLLALNLKSILDTKKLTNSAVARVAGVSEGTIRNYLSGADSTRTKSGKERSAKLVEIETLAAALDVHPLALLADPDLERQRVQQISQLIAEQIGKYEVSPASSSPAASDPPREKHHPRAA